MKLNCKGFMLAEVVVVSVVIASVLVTLFAGLNKVSSAYETRNRYYDVDSLYAAIDMNDIMIKENIISSLKNSNGVFPLYTSHNAMNEYMEFYDNSSEYQLVGSYAVFYNKNKLEQLKQSSIKQTFKDYIDYLDGNIDFSLDYDYIVITERCNYYDNDDCYYYALKLKF